ncbi:hypothetical protein C8F01DRAFT_1253668 [Mycena amicta]|nr:hypothetical protein C8F01DRAFT_1253668 [Mycena amicta]
MPRVQPPQDSQPRQSNLHREIDALFASDSESDDDLYESDFDSGSARDLDYNPTESDSGGTSDSDMQVDSGSDLALRTNSPGDLLTFLLQRAPDKANKPRWLQYYRENPALHPALFAEWKRRLDCTLQAGTLESAQHVLDECILSLRQMRVVEAMCQSDILLVKTSGLAATICDLSGSVATLDSSRPELLAFFIRNRAADTLCEVLDRWVAKISTTWIPEDAVCFTYEPLPQANVLSPASFWAFMNDPANYDVFRGQLAQTVQLFVSAKAFVKAYHTWLAPLLQGKGYDLRTFHQQPEDLYSQLMAHLARHPGHVTKLKDNELLKTMLTEAIRGRERVRKAVEHANEIQHRLPASEQDREIPRFCVLCEEMPVEKRCRRKLLVVNQSVEFLRGCGITLAGPEEQMQPKPRTGPKKNVPHKRMWTPEELKRERNITLEKVAVDREVVERCGCQVFYFVDHDVDAEKALDVLIYGAMSTDEHACMVQRHRQKMTGDPLTRGEQFQSYSDGHMEQNGSIQGSGGVKGAAYAPPIGFQANSAEGVVKIYQEAADTNVILETLKRFHPRCVRELTEHTATADLLGNWGVTTYKCCNYCAPQHADNDACRGISYCAEWKALPGEYAFCQPSYGYYIEVGLNTLWTFDANCIHGTMLPARTRLDDALPRAKFGGRLSTGTHITATQRNIKRAGVYDLIRRTKIPRKHFWETLE